MTTSPPVLPRSALLCSWGTAALRGRVSTAQAVRAVQGQDEPHGVVLTQDPLVRPCHDLAGLLDAVRSAGTTRLRLVLPVPGDLAGLAGPPAVNTEAVEAGECVLTDGGAPLALVPHVEGFGSVHEPGHLVIWSVHDATTPPPWSDSVSDVERRLREGLLHVAREIGDLGLGDSGLSRGGPELADRLTDIRYGRGPSAELPDGLPPRSLRVLDLAWRVRGIIEVAREDDGGSVSGWEATRRATALDRLDDVGRHAVVAALNDDLDGAPPVARAHPRTAS